jgi:hypothetical protein
MAALSAVGEALATGKINLDEPRWDQVLTHMRTGSVDTNISCKNYVGG